MVRRNTERRVVETGRVESSLYVLLGQYDKLIMYVCMVTAVVYAGEMVDGMVKSLPSTLKR